MRGVAAAAAARHHPGLGSINRVLGSDGEPIGGGAGHHPASRTGSTTTRSAPYRPHRGPGPGGRRRGGPQRRRRRGRRPRASATRSRSSRRTGRSEYTLVGTFALGAAKSAGGAVTVGLHPRRGPAARRRSTAEITAIYVQAEDGVARRSWPTTIAPIARGRRPRRSPARRRPPSSPSESQTNFEFLTLALTIFGGDRPAGRDLRDLQHLLDPRGPAHRGAGPAARARRQPGPGARLGAARGRAWSAPWPSVLGLFGGLCWPRASPPASARVGRLAAERVAGGRARHDRASRWSSASGSPCSPRCCPALRATRVPPLAALRDVAIDRSNLSRRPASCVGVLALAASAPFNLSAAWRGQRRHRRASSPVGIGAVLTDRRRPRGRARARRPRASGCSARPLPRFTRRHRASWPRRTPPAAPSAPRPPPRPCHRRGPRGVHPGVRGVGRQVRRSGGGARASPPTSWSAASRRASWSRRASRRASPSIVRAGRRRRRREPRSASAAVGLQYPDGKTATHFVTAIEPDGDRATSSRPKMDERRRRRPRPTRACSSTTGVADEHDMELGDPIVVHRPRRRAASQLRGRRASPTTGTCSASSPSPEPRSRRSARRWSTSRCPARSTPGADIDTVIAADLDEPSRTCRR